MGYGICFSKTDCRFTCGLMAILIRFVLFLFNPICISNHFEGLTYLGHRLQKKQILESHFLCLRKNCRGQKTKVSMQINFKTVFLTDWAFGKTVTAYSIGRKTSLAKLSTCPPPDTWSFFRWHSTYPRQLSIEIDRTIGQLNSKTEPAS